MFASFQLATDKDRREAAAIEKRRAFDEERKKRIFNPRTRLIGCDLTALQEQIEQKKIRDAEDGRVSKIFEEQLQKADQLAMKYEEKEKRERKKLEKEINNFRQTCQKKEDTREYDLNDPNYIKKQLPVRIHDNDPRCGPSSAQKFEGEDSLYHQRKQVQRDQIKSWLDQQMQEKERAERERKAADEAYLAAVVARDQRALELDRMEKQCRKQLLQSAMQFNRALADERFCAIEKQKKQMYDDNMAEICNTLTSDMMTENTAVADSNLGIGRKVGYMYKGMTPDELKEFKDYQCQQIADAKKKKEIEQRMEQEFNEYFNETQRMIRVVDMEQEKKNKDLQKQLAEENRKLGEEQKQQREFMNKIVYRNRATESFFDQFNKTTR